MLPAIKTAGEHLDTIASGGGVSASRANRSVAVATATADAEQILQQRNDQYGMYRYMPSHTKSLVCRAYVAGKQALVEKPSAINQSQLHAFLKPYPAHPATTFGS